jgi:hypothetical protein
VTIDVLRNDTDPDNQLLTVTGATNGTGGSVSINTDGTVTYTASAAFSGTDAFAYFISDGNGGSATGTVTVTVNLPIPPPPPPSEGSAAFYFPEVTDGRVDHDEVLRTLIILSNPTGAPVTGAITLRLVEEATHSAVPGAIPFRCMEVDQATCAVKGATLHSDAQGVLSFGIAPQGQVVLMTDRDATSAVAHGYAEVTSAMPISGVALIALYDDGKIGSQSAVPATGTMRKFAVTDFGSDSKTALAVVNLGTQATTLTLRQFAASGTETGGPATLALAAGEHRVFFLKDVLSGSGSRFGMVIVESSDAQVTAASLKFDDDEFAIVPVIKIE